MVKIKRLMRKDILLRPLDVNEYVDTIIHIHSNNEKNDSLNYFEVLMVSDNVTMINVGDTIILPHLEHMIPFSYEGKMCTVTSEDSVAAVIQK